MDTDPVLAVFGLAGHFTQADLDEAYRDLVQVWHPDRYAYNPRLQRKAEEKSKEINHAYTLLQERLSRSAARSTPAEAPPRHPPGGYRDVHLYEGWEWEHATRQGDVVQEILALGRERTVDLLVMATQGHEGFLDVLRGSTTEQVLRGARCPLLAVPALSTHEAGASGAIPL